MVVRRLAKWKRVAVSRLSLRYPTFLRFLPTPRPLAVQSYPYEGPSSSRDLLVCLPGIGDEATDFSKWGFVELLRAHGWPADVLLVDAHYGYYADRTVLEQLRHDVLLPASTSRYRAIWLVGISLGGLGALLYASRYPYDIQGVLAIAPFLGGHTLTQEISGAGGLAQWTATVNPTDDMHVLWSWAHAHGSRSAAVPEIFLAFGETDVFADAHRLLAASLPAGNVLTAFGGHRWPVWLDLWKKFVCLHVARVGEGGTAPPSSTGGSPSRPHTRSSL